MLLDLFNKKKGAPDKKPQQPPQPSAAPQPAAASSSQNPVSAQQPSQSQQPTRQTPEKPAPSAQPAQPAQQAGSAKPVLGGSSALNVDDIYPVILRRIKEEFKSVASEAEKLSEYDKKIEAMNKTVDELKKFMDDSKQSLEEVKSKTDKFDMAMYELATTKYNPFIKASAEEASAKKTEYPAEQERSPAKEEPKPRRSPQEDASATPASASPVEASFSSGTSSSQKTSAEASPEPSREDSGKQDSSSASKENIDQAYEEELRKIMGKTKDALQQPPGGESVNPETPSNKADHAMVVEDALNQKTESVAIPPQDKTKEQAFLDGAKQLTPGVNYDRVFSDREQIKEQIVVEDVLDVPKEGSDSHEVSETLSFKETWNDPEAHHLEKTPPKLKRLDLKDLLGKFLHKHDRQETSLDDYQENASLAEERSPQESVSAEKPEQPALSREERALHAEKQRILHMNVTDPQKYFWFTNGKVAKNLPDFVMALNELDEKDFAVHVREGKNDFASWIRGVFHSDILADLLQHCTTKKAMLSILK